MNFLIMQLHHSQSELRSSFVGFCSRCHSTSSTQQCCLYILFFNYYRSGTVLPLGSHTCPRHTSHSSFVDCLPLAGGVPSFQLSEPKLWDFSHTRSEDSHLHYNICRCDVLRDTASCSRFHWYTILCVIFLAGAYDKQSLKRDGPWLRPSGTSGTSSTGLPPFKASMLNSLFFALDGYSSL